MLQKLSIILFFFLYLSVRGTAQTVVAFQGGEGTAADNWNFNAITSAGGSLPPGIVATLPRTGSKSIRAAGGNSATCTSGTDCIVGGFGQTGCSMHGKTIQFDPINVACLSNVQFSVYHRSHTFCLGNGFDVSEFIYFEVSLNGGAFTPIDTLGGFADYAWTYATNPAGSLSASPVKTVPNPFVYDVPAGTNTFAFRVRCTTASNRSDEVFYIDDVKLTTTSTAYNFPGTAGLWNGEVSTDWANPCNWDTRVIPTSGTDVYIPNSASKICEIFAGTTANCRELKIDKDKLAIETSTSAINVYGDLIIDANGVLDMDLAGTQGGILNLRGNWINKRNASYFEEGLSSVSFVGTIDQSLTVNGDTKEAFYKLRSNKVSGTIIANDDIWVDPLNIGGATAMLTLSSGLVNLNGHELKIWNENFQSVNRTGGGCISELTNNSGKISRVMNANAGNYIFPFAKADGSYIPFVFFQTSGNAGVVTAATYATPADNLPWPTTPVNVTNLISALGLSPDNRDATVDRFWNIDASGSSTADLTFSYAAGELPIAPYNNPLTLKAQRYNNSTDLWQPYLPGQGANFYFVYVPAVSNFATWTLTNDLSPLPVELLIFEANLNNKNEVDLNWATASEINNDYFTVEKSENGADFKTVEIVKGAGTTTNLSYYSTIDKSPLNGISYYRLKQTDFDGTSKYSQVVKINFLQTSIHSFTLFPNPADDYFYLFIDESHNTDKLYLTDLSGKTVREIKNVDVGRVLKVEKGTLSRGMYFISDGMGTTHKIVFN